MDSLKQYLIFISGVSIITGVMLIVYSIYLRFTTQDEYFTWLWNASAEVQYATGWALALFLISYVVIVSVKK